MFQALAELAGSAVGIFILAFIVMILFVSLIGPVIGILIFLLINPITWIILIIIIGIVVLINLG